MAPFEIAESYHQASAPLDYLKLRESLVYAIHIVGKLMQKKGFVDIEFYASRKRTICRMN